MWDNVLMEIKEGVAIVTINRPKQLNALSYDVMRDLGSCAAKIKEDDTIKAVILTGAGDKAFVAGADVEMMMNLDPAPALDFVLFGQQVIAALEALPQPFIGAINGFCLGGGNELALACDIRVASKKAKFGQPEVGLGVCPGWGGTQRLPRLIGLSWAKYLDFTGDIIDAETALGLGLVNFVTEPEALMDKAIEIAGKIVKQRAFAVRQTKLCIRRGLEASLPTAMGFEGQAFALCFAHPDRKEAMTAFINKTKK